MASSSSRIGSGFRGGVRQKLSQHIVVADAPRAPSVLAKLLLSRYYWGEMSAKDVQVLASAALKDGSSHPELVELADVGASKGRAPR